MVDIIIPIVNSNADLLNCIKCIYANTEDYKIFICVNKGLNQYIYNLLADISKDQLFLHESEQYLSFYQLANLAVKKSKNDIVLLDPGICVTSNWLMKLIECAYSDRTIGTVTPFCNNGSICSIPNFTENNNINQYGLSVTEIANIVESLSSKEYPILPHAVGFCMYIKRETLDYVGVFEEYNYGYGFGEDVEFSWRAKQYGFSHVLCDNTFVYCMDSTLLETYKKHVGIKKIHHEKYIKEIEAKNEYVNMNSLSNIQKTIQAKLLSMNGKRNIFINLHFGFEPENLNYMGGTQFLVKDIVCSLNYKYNFFVFFLDYQGATLNLYCNRKKYSFNYKMDNNFRTVEFSNRTMNEILTRIFILFNIDLIHIHHTIAQTFDVAYAAKKLNIPYIVSLHDYYWICPSFNLISCENEFCYGIKENEYCGICLLNKLKLNENILGIWRERALEVLSGSQTLVVPSSSTMGIYARVYPELVGKFKLIAHGIRKNGNTKRKSVVDFNNINIAFVGSLTHQKGSDIAYKLITHECNTQFNWFFFGDIHDNRFRNIEQNNVVIYGTYQREDLNDLLYSNNINAVCVLSTVPETYCFVLSEVLEAGIPVIASDIGALSERIIESKGGWLIPSDAEPEAVYSILNEIRDDPSKYYKALEALCNYPAQYIDNMANEYLALYDKYLL